MLSRPLLVGLCAMSLVVVGCGEESGDKRANEDRANPGATGTSGPRGNQGLGGRQGLGAGGLSGGGLDLREGRDSRQAAWENQDGDDWFAYEDGYSEGFEDACDELFDAADGTLYEEPPQGDPYDSGYQYRGQDWDEYDCQRLEDDPEDPPYEVPFDPYDSGYEQGFVDGCRAPFDDSYERTLYTEDGGEIDVYQCE